MITVDESSPRFVGVAVALIITWSCQVWWILSSKVKLRKIFSILANWFNDFQTMCYKVFYLNLFECRMLSLLNSSVMTDVYDTILPWSCINIFDIGFDPLKILSRYCKFVKGRYYPKTLVLNRINYFSSFKETKFDQPLKRFSLEEQASMSLKFYNVELHTAAFALPQFFEKVQS